MHIKEMRRYWRHLIRFHNIPVDPGCCLEACQFLSKYDSRLTLNQGIVLFNPTTLMTHAWLTIKDDQNQTWLVDPTMGQISQEIDSKYKTPALGIYPYNNGVIKILKYTFVYKQC